MSLDKPDFTLGIEEEYLLVNRATRDLVTEAPGGLMNECEVKLHKQVSPEFLKCQIEVATGVCTNIDQARSDLRNLRQTIASLANKHQLAPIAASTHPFAEWSKQHHTDRDRYQTLAKDLQGVAQRMLICGMHIHVGIDDEELRIDIFNQLSYFLPHLLALSTSSPFWQGRDTGLKSYRLTIFDNLPRTGLPPIVESAGQYNRMIHTLTGTGVIEDATKIWWDLRPSNNFPTIELRICDLPTRLEDTLCIAALFQCLTRMLYRLRRDNQRWRQYDRFLINENRWRAQRYGMDEGLIDFGRGEIVPYADLIEELIEMLTPDAEALGCLNEIKAVRTIAQNGTSADRQRKTFNTQFAATGDRQKALEAVVDQLIEETVA